MDGLTSRPAKNGFDNHDHKEARQCSQVAIPYPDPP